MKLTDTMCVPALRTVPAAGEYVNVPLVLAVALSWVAPSGVPYAIAAGAYHVTCGFACATSGR